MLQAALRWASRCGAASFGRGDSSCATTIASACLLGAARRVQVARLRLELAVEALLHPETPLALRLSGQLLLGLVRLYSKQIGYLQQVW